MKFFFWSKTITGKWSPTAATSKPDPKGGHGGWKAKTTAVIELPDEDRDLSLDALALKYPMPVEEVPEVVQPEPTRLTEDQLVALLKSSPTKGLVGCTFTHVKSGKEYALGFSHLNESDLTVHVTYSPIGNMALIFSRPAAEFMDGRFTLNHPTFKDGDDDDDDEPEMEDA